jgi:hypothetical protein
MMLRDRLLAMERAQPVGFAALDMAGSIPLVLVAMGCQRRGIGTALLTAALGQLAAGLGSAAEHALISPLALNGLRVPEAVGADIEPLGLERGHRTSPSSAREARSSPSRSRRGQHRRSTWRLGSALRRPSLPRRRQTAAGCSGKGRQAGSRNAR